MFEGSSIILIAVSPIMVIFIGTPFTGPILHSYRRCLNQYGRVIVTNWLIIQYKIIDIMRMRCSTICFYNIERGIKIKHWRDRIEVFCPVHPLTIQEVLLSRMISKFCAFIWGMIILALNPIIKANVIIIVLQIHNLHETIV